MAVYRALLESYRPQDIGIFGFSAGGALTAQAAALFPMRGLPQPAGIGIFGAGAVRFMEGDSAHVAGYTDGAFPPPSPKSAAQGEAAVDPTRGYFDGTAAMTR